MAHGTVITVFSPKGGAGTSMIACNLALVLAGRATGPVILIDGDFEFGDVAVMLQIAPRASIIDVIAHLPEVDERYIARHPSGLLVIAGPADPAAVDQILPYQVLDTLDALAEACQYVVVDTGSQFSEHNLAIVDRSDQIVLVAGMDVPSVKNVKLGLQTLRLLGVPPTKIHLVLNRSGSRVKLEVPEVERMLRMRAACLVPSDIIVPRSVNRGVPVVLGSPRSSVARAIEGFADRFMPVSAHADGHLP